MVNRDIKQEEWEMKSKRIVSVVLICVMMVTSFAALTSCKKKEEKPKTLEEFVEKSDSAKEELSQISDSMSNDLMDGTMEVVGDDIIIKLTFKETYDEKYFDEMSKAMEEKLDDYKETFNDALSEIEKNSGIEDIGLKMVVLNGDGQDIYSVDLE